MKEQRSYQNDERGTLLEKIRGMSLEELRLLKDEIQKILKGYYATGFYDGPRDGSWINGFITFNSEDLPVEYRYGIWVLTREVDFQLQKIYYSLKEKKEKEEKRFEKFLKRLRKFDFEHLKRVRDYAEELVEWRKKGGDQWK
jgi:hypothetical protein